jgi:hypothetical protein
MLDRRGKGYVVSSTIVTWVIIRVIILVGTLAGVVVLLRKVQLAHKKNFWLAGLISVLLACLLPVGFALLKANSVGLSAVFLAPLLNGILFVFLYAYLCRNEADFRGKLPSFLQLAILLPLYISCLQMVVLFSLLLEGIICLLMAAPFLIGFTLLGSILAYWVLRSTPRRPGKNTLSCIVLLGLLPLAVQPVENQHLVETLTTKVTTEIVINASPQEVFSYVQGFPRITSQELHHPEEALFLMGLPAPTQSVIDCHGPGCMRHCLFSQNTRFDEKVMVYKPDKELTFMVTSVVGPQNPVTGVDIHVMPGGMYFNNHQGQFLLDEIAPGKTRVRGTTWYTLKSSLNWYAKPWADLMLHTIHQRVLEHIKVIAEAEPA